MTSRFPLTAILGLSLLQGCVSVPREAATALATRGATTSDLAATDVRRLGQRLDDIEEINAFHRTYSACNAPGVADRTRCTTDPQTEENAQAAEELITIIDARATALTELGDAYRAFKTEAEYDAEADLKSAVQSLATSVNAYASLLGPETEIVRAPIVALATHAAGWWARDQQRQRLIQASSSIGASLHTLRLALEKEAETYDRVSEQFARDEQFARSSLFQSGLILRAPTLAPMAAGLGVTLAPTAEATLNADLSARIAAQAYLEGRSMDEVRKQRQRYQILIAGLGRLETAHTEFAEARTFDPADFDRLMLELAALLTEVRGDPQ